MTVIIDTATVELDPAPPHGVERRRLVPEVVRHADGTIRLELGYSFEHGPGVRAEFEGTPQTIIRDYLQPLLNAALAAAEPDHEDEVYAIVAAASPQDDDPDLEPLVLFAAGWLTGHPMHAIRHQMTLDDAIHDRSLNAKFLNFLEASCPKLDRSWRP